MTSVLALTNMYPPHAFGGAEMVCRDVMTRFRDRGWRTSVLTTDLRLQGVDDALDERRSGVFRDLRFYWNDHRLLRPSVLRCAVIERHNHRALARALDTVQPDVISVWTVGAMSLSLLTVLVDAGIPMVFCVCDDWLVYGPDLDPWTRRFASRPRLASIAERVAGVPARVADLGSAGTFCFVSGATEARAEEKSRWTFPDAHVVHHGVDITEFPLDREPAARPWTWKLLYVGRLDRRKGIETAIRALAPLPPEATLTIMGRGDPAEEERLHALVARLDAADRVLFSHCGRDQLREVYASADVLIFPSVWTEPFGLTPLEAMACGTPVVATRVGGSAEYLTDELNCLSFQSGDAAGCAAVVTRLASDTDLRARLIAGGIRTAGDLTIDRTAEALASFHQAAARRGSSRRNS